MRRFTVRDLFWLTLVVGLAVGWWVDRSGLKQRLDTVGSWYRDLSRDSSRMLGDYWALVAKADWLAMQLTAAGWTVDLERLSPPWADPPQSAASQP